VNPVTLGARGPELTTPTVAQSIRTDLPPDAIPPTDAASFPYFVGILVVIVIAVAAALAYWFYWR